PHRGLVDPRAGHRAHGQRPQDVGADPAPAEPRREEPVRGGRLEPRQRVLPEPDLDDHGPGLALVRLPRGRAAQGEPVSLSRRDALKLAAAAAATPLLPKAAPAGVAEAAAPAAAAASVAKPIAGRFFTAPEMALLDELVEMIIPSDAHSGGARAA